MLLTIKSYLFKKLIYLYMYTYKQKSLHRVLIGKFIPYSVRVGFIAQKHADTFGFGINKRIHKINLVHIVSSGKINDKNSYLGSVKDILYKQEIFEQHFGDKFQEFIVPKGDKPLYYFLRYNIRHLKKLPSNVIMYLDMPGSYHKSLKYLRQVLPSSIIVFRSHNAEPYHNYDKFKATWKIQWLIRALKTSYSDRKLLGYVDYVDIISKYDLVHYWEPLALTKYLFKLRYLPFCYSSKLKKTYFKDYQYSDEFSSPPQIISFGSVGQKRNPLNISNSDSTIPALLKNHYNVNELLVTGNCEESTNNSNYYKYTGYIDDPNKLLASSDILLDLSSLGYGFKTKYLDAALSGCKILIDDKYLSRLPLELYPFLILRKKNNSLYELSSVSRSTLREHAYTINSNYFQISKKLLLELCI